MRKPKELNEIEIEIFAKTSSAVNRIDKLTYAVWCMNKELKVTKQLIKYIERKTWLNKIYKLIKK